MRSRTYLNVILSVNAVLLAALVWTQLGGAAPMASQAFAQERGIPNAAAQRVQIIDAVHAMRQSLEASNRLLEGGKLRVEVTNLDDIRITPPPSDG